MAFCSVHDDFVGSHLCPVGVCRRAEGGSTRRATFAPEPRRPPKTQPVSEMEAVDIDVEFSPGWSSEEMQKVEKVITEVSPPSLDLQ